MTQHVDLDPAQWTALRTAYEAGEPTASLSNRFGPSASTITKRAAAERWTRSPPPTPEPLAPIDPDHPTLEQAAAQALARSLTAFGRGDGPGAARWLRLHAAYAGLIRRAETVARDQVNTALAEAKALADSVGALAKAYAAGVPEADLTPMLEMLEARNPPNATKKHALDPAECARLTRARDKARRRGLHKRADALDALLRPP